MMLSELGQRQILCNITYLWNYKIEKKIVYSKADIENKLWLPVWRGKGDGKKNGRGLRGTNYYV